MSLLPPSPHHLDDRNGPILIGFTIECLLFGLLIAQFCMYVRGHKWHRDGALMQALVYSLCFVESFRLVVVVQSVWGLLIRLSAPPGRVSSSTPLAVALPALAGFESAIVQIFFAWRILSMRRRERPYWGAAAIIVLIAIMQAVGSVGLSYRLQHAVVLNEPYDHHEHSSTFTVVWLGGSFVCDLFIVIAMSFILISLRREAAFLETERLVNYLLRLTAETGALTVIAAALMLGLHLKYPKDSYCLGILFILGGLYINILLYMLNCRQNTSATGHTERVSLHLTSILQVTRSVSTSSQPSARLSTHETEKTSGMMQ